MEALQYKYVDMVSEFLMDDKKLEFEHKFGYPELVVNIIKDMGGTVETETWNTNGWQCDWWMQGELKGKILDINGSCYYGGLSITKRESE